MDTWVQSLALEERERRGREEKRRWNERGREREGGGGRRERSAAGTIEP